MKTIQQLCTWIKILTGFAMLSFALFIIVYYPYLYQSQPYLLLHWAGIGISIIVVAQKVSDYTHYFTSPHQSLFWLLMQLAFIPIFSEILTRYFHLPSSLAFAFSLAALSPGELTHTVLKTLFLTSCVFILHWIGFYSPIISEGVEVMNDPSTKYIVVGIAFVPILYHEYRKWKQKNQPVKVIVIEDEEKYEKTTIKK